LEFCVSVFNALLLYLLFHRAALPFTSIALHLHWIGHRHYTLTENTTLEIKGQLHPPTTFTPFCSFFFFCNCHAPSPTTTNSDHLATHMMELLAFLSSAFVLLQDQKAYVRSMYLAFHSLKATSKYFVVPAIL